MLPSIILVLTPGQISKVSSTSHTVSSPSGSCIHTRQTTSKLRSCTCVCAYRAVEEVRREDLVDTCRGVGDQSVLRIPVSGGYEGGRDRARAYSEAVQPDERGLVTEQICDGLCTPKWRSGIVLQHVRW